jgi:hypothetical protein
MRAMRRLGLCILAVLALSGAGGAAHADEPVAAREPQMMSETSEITSVVDAFDKDDPFDLNIILGFRQSWKAAKIRRESQIPQNGLAGQPGSPAGFIPATLNVAKYSSSMSTLDLGADIGLYHDLALIFRFPIILSWSQSLGDLDGSSAIASQILADPSGGQLFTVPFSSPTRSGIDYISGGIDWAIFNQQRDFTKPTWVIGVEGRLSVGSPLHACQAVNGTNVCPNPDGTPGNRTPGISPGYESLIAKTVWSRRFGYVEPYTGFWFQADFPKGGTDFSQWNPQQNLSRTPPLLGSFLLGFEVVPYEAREQFQRFSVDFRAKGTYHSPGRDYSELFDPLGSSQAKSLRSANPASYTLNNNQSVADPAAESIYFTGITEQQAFGSFTLSSSLTWQAGQYVKFTAGGGFTYVQSHLVTGADECTPNGNTSIGPAGPCLQNGTVNGVPNPDHRDIIDLPGHRFAVDDSTIVDLYLMGVVMF